MNKSKITFIGALALLSLGIYNYKSRELSKLESKVDINFENAKNDPNLREQYLGKLLHDETKYIEARDCIEKLIYDTNFKKRDEWGKQFSKKGQTGIKYLNEANYVDGKEIKDSKIQGLMCTLSGKSIFGKRALIHIEDFAFSYCQNENEFLSGLDNEAFTARGLYKSQAHWLCPESQ